MTEKKNRILNLNLFGSAHRWVAELLLAFGKSNPTQSPEAQEASKNKLLKKIEELKNKPQ